MAFISKVVDSGIIHCKANIERRNGSYMRVLTAKPKKLINTPELFGKTATLPYKNYLTKGLIAPQNANYCTLEFWHKMMEDRYVVVDNEDNQGEFASVGYLPRSHQEWGGVPMPGLANKACDTLIKEWGINHGAVERKFIKSLSANYSSMANGNMTFDIERLSTVNASEALINLENLLEANKITILGDSWGALIDAVFKLFHLETVTVKVYDDEDDYTYEKITQEVFKIRAFTHKMSNKNQEKGKSEPRAIACASNIYKPICKVIELFSAAVLAFVPNEIITVGGPKKDQIVRDILTNEELLIYPLMICGSEDKSGWNRQITSLLMHAIFSKMSAPMTERTKNLVNECMKAGKYKYLSMKKFRMYNEDNTAYKNLNFHILRWDQLNARYKKIFFNSEKIFNDMQRNYLDCTLKDSANPVVQSFDAMVMGFWNDGSTFLRACGDALFRYFGNKIVLELADRVGLTGRLESLSEMAFSSDDSISVHAARLLMVAKWKQSVQSAIDNALCMKLSGKKTNYTLGEPLRGVFGEITTDYYFATRKKNPGSKALTQLALHGRSIMEEVKSLLRFPAFAAEEANMHLSLYSAIEINRLLSIMLKMNINKPDPENPRVKFLTENGLYGCSVLHGLHPALDPLSACGDALVLPVIRGEAEPWTIHMARDTVGNALKEDLPLKWGVTDMVDQMSFATVYGAPPVGTMAFIKSVNKSNLDKKKTTKSRFTSIRDAVMTLSDGMVNLRSSNVSPLNNMIASLLRLKETVTNQEVLNEIDNFRTELIIQSEHAYLN